MTTSIPSPARSQFTEEAIAVMDDLAILVRAAEQLRGRFSEFKKNPLLDHRAARPHVEKIIALTRGAARDLQRALFLKQSKRTKELADAHHFWSEELRVAVKLAERLSAQEFDATQGVSNVIEVMVFRSLEDLANRWATPGRE
ncbi:hypothetical protein ABIC83_002885 [Roseateles asaccharophilus]|uniref:hypothetical protein n=1 Tax=Roseateles asaccharophilus TaxID=582607 RepID=UPI0038383A27